MLLAVPTNTAYNGFEFVLPQLPRVGVLGVSVLRVSEQVEGRHSLVTIYLVQKRVVVDPVGSNGSDNKRTGKELHLMLYYFLGLSPRGVATPQPNFHLRNESCFGNTICACKRMFERIQLSHNMLGQVNNSVSVTPFVIVLGNEFNEGIVQHDSVGQIIQQDSFMSNGEKLTACYTRGCSRSKRIRQTASLLSSRL